MYTASGSIFTMKPVPVRIFPSDWAITFTTADFWR